MSGAGGSEVTRRTRVLLVGRGLGLGGMERLLVNQVKFGDRSKFDYSVAYVVAEKTALVPEFEALGVRVSCLSDGRAPWPVALRTMLQGERFDVVHTHSPLVASAARLVAHTVRPVPLLVYTEHNSWDPYSPPTRLANRLTYPLDDAQIAVSRAAAESVPAQLRSRLQVLDHGIDLVQVADSGSDRAAARRLMGVGPEELLVGTVANLRPEKNYDGLLRTASQVTAARDAVRFVSIGQGPLQRSLAEHHAASGLGDRFQFLGHRTDATALMAGFDIFVLASHWEGLPVAFMEARALGLPVVVTAVGGLVDHVRDGVDGLLVEPGSDDELARGLLRLLDDAVLRRRMALASAESAAPFDARMTVQRIEERYVRVPAAG